MTDNHSASLQTLAEQLQNLRIRSPDPSLVEAFEGLFGHTGDTSADAVTAGQGLNEREARTEKSSAGKNRTG